VGITARFVHARRDRGMWLDLTTDSQSTIYSKSFDDTANLFGINVTALYH
jgi:hypothetical protein